LEAKWLLPGVPKDGTTIGPLQGRTLRSDVPTVSKLEEQAESATGVLKDTMEAESESVDESTDGSMETSSDGGSTVRELNRQLDLHTGGSCG